MKLLLFFAFLLLNNIKCTDSTLVYVCDSDGAVKYHNSPKCRGLSNCQYRVVKTTLETAKGSGKTLCKWE